MMSKVSRLVRKLLSPDAPAKIERRLRTAAIARSVIRPNPFLAGLCRQLRINRLRYGSGQTALVCGVGGDIGEAIAHQLVLQGCRVIGTYRDRRPELAGNAGIQLFQLDITSVDQVSDFYKELDQQSIRLDLIVVATGFNSGLDYHASNCSEELTRETLSLEYQDILQSFQSNTLGPYLLMRRFADLLNVGIPRRGIPQICLLSSSLGTMNNELYGGSYGYRTGKGALHSLSMAVYCDLNIDAHVGIQILGPGNVNTRMNPGGLMPVELAASEIIANIEFNRKRPRFQFLGPKGRRIPW